MAMTLPPIPMAYSPAFSEEPRVRRVQFGDGYSVRSDDGLNPLSTKVNAVWKAISSQQMRELNNFFSVHRGTYYFNWIPTGYSTPKKFICTAWSYEPVRDLRRPNTGMGDEHYYDMTATFEQVHDLG